MFKIIRREEYDELIKLEQEFVRRLAEATKKRMDELYEQEIQRYTNRRIAIADLNLIHNERIERRDKTINAQRMKIAKLLIITDGLEGIIDKLKAKRRKKK